MGRYWSSFGRGLSLVVLRRIRGLCPDGDGWWMQVLFPYFQVKPSADVSAQGCVMKRLKGSCARTWGSHRARLSCASEEQMGVDELREAWREGMADVCISLMWSYVSPRSSVVSRGPCVFKKEEVPACLMLTQTKAGWLWLLPALTHWSIWNFREYFHPQNWSPNTLIMRNELSWQTLQPISDQINGYLTALKWHFLNFSPAAPVTDQLYHT